MWTPEDTCTAHVLNSLVVCHSVPIWWLEVPPPIIQPRKPILERMSVKSQKRHRKFVNPVHLSSSLSICETLLPKRHWKKAGSGYLCIVPDDGWRTSRNQNATFLTTSSHLSDPLYRQNMSNLDSRMRRMRCHFSSCWWFSAFGPPLYCPAFERTICYYLSVWVWLLFLLVCGHRISTDHTQFLSFHFFGWCWLS